MEKTNKEIKGILQEVEYGYIKLKLDEYLTEKGISTYELSTKSNIRFQTIQTLRKDTATRIDFSVLARLCYVLGCTVGDLIEYVEN